MMLSYARCGLGGPQGANCMTTSSYESLSHSKWDYKYHVVFLPKGRKKALYGKIRVFSWAGAAGAGWAAWEHHHRRAYGAGPCPHAHPDSAEVCGGRGDWVYQGQECHRRCSTVRWATKKL